MLSPKAGCRSSATSRGRSGTYRTSAPKFWPMVIQKAGLQNLHRLLEGLAAVEADLPAADGAALQLDGAAAVIVVIQEATLPPARRSSPRS